MSATVIEGMGMGIAKIDETDLICMGPWVRSAQQRLFLTLEKDYGFPRATCRSLVNLMWDFLNGTFGDKLYEGQITFHAVSEAEPPGKPVSDLKTVPVHLTVHDRTDIEVLNKEGIVGLQRKKVLRMANEAREQGGLLIQEDLAVLMCSSRRTIRRDIRALKKQGIEVPTKGYLQDIGPGVADKSKVVKMWLDCTENMDIEQKTGKRKQGERMINQQADSLKSGDIWHYFRSPPIYKYTKHIENTLLQTVPNNFYNS